MKKIYNTLYTSMIFGIAASLCILFSIRIQALPCANNAIDKIQRPAWPQGTPANKTTISVFTSDFNTNENIRIGTALASW